MMQDFQFCGMKLDHIGMVVPDIDETVRTAWALLGLGPWRLDESPAAARAWACGREIQNRQRVAFAAWGALQIELIQPLPGAEGPCAELLEKTGGRGAVHHLGFIAASPEEAERAAAHLRDSGFRELLLVRDAAPGGGGDMYMFDLRPHFDLCLEVAAPITLTPELLARGRWYPEKPENSIYRL